LLDGISLDQLRAFIAAVEEGSFSAAGRRLRRAQSAVSQSLANLEAQLGVQLFTRSGRFPVLTDQGRSLLAEARSVTAQVDRLKARAKALAGGLEPELSLVADVMFPVARITGVISAFQEQFPTTALKLYVEGWGAVVQHVLDGRCGVGVLGSYWPAPAQFVLEPLLTIPMVMVVSPRHALAAHRGPIPSSALADHIQLLHTDRSDLPAELSTGVLSPRTWLLAHLGAKLAFLRAGFGFGVLPLHNVAADLASGALVSISAEAAPAWSAVLGMAAIYRADSPPGPAGRWLIEQLKQVEGLGKPAAAGRRRPAVRPRKVAGKTLKAPERRTHRARSRRR